MPQFSIRSKRLEYKIEFKGKYTVIHGDSGTGKTNLCSLVRDYAFGDHTIKIESPLSIMVLDTVQYEIILNGTHDSIIIIDENYPALHDRLIAKMLQDSDNYFIIISRDTLNWLPLNVENLYDMVADGKKHYLRQKFD